MYALASLSAVLTSDSGLSSPSATRSALLVSAITCAYSMTDASVVPVEIRSSRVVPRSGSSRERYPGWRAGATWPVAVVSVALVPKKSPRSPMPLASIRIGVPSPTPPAWALRNAWNASEATNVWPRDFCSAGASGSRTTTTGPVDLPSGSPSDSSGTVTDAMVDSALRAASLDSICSRRDRI